MNTVVHSLLKGSIRSWSFAFVSDVCNLGLRLQFSRESGKAGCQMASASTTFAFTEADLKAYEKGLAQETALVRAAKVRGDNAKTPAERGKAAQDEWEDQTIPGGAQAAGLPVERYRNVRQAVNWVLETLDFQGKINGPLEIDVEHATPEMKQRLSSDPFGELLPGLRGCPARPPEQASSSVGAIHATDCSKWVSTSRK